MLDMLSVYLNYERGKASGHGGLRFIVAFVLFLIFFKPIVWVMKITGIFALIQWTGLIDPQGMFSFEMAFVYFMLFAVFIFTVCIIGIFFSWLSTFLISSGNRSHDK